MQWGDARSPAYSFTYMILWILMENFVHEMLGAENTRYRASLPYLRIESFRICDNAANTGFPRTYTYNQDGTEQSEINTVIAFVQIHLPIS